LRILLDEHFSGRAAAELRRRGYEATAVTECRELRGLPDAELFAHAQSEGYAIVTQDYADFTALVRAAAIEEAEHAGVIFVPKRLWSSIRDVDRLVDSAARFLDEHEGEETFRGLVAWLS
jgi:Domain of unknown function (DUF5615)